MASLQKQPDLIFLTELWIYSPEAIDFNIQDYYCYANTKNSYVKGGVGVLIKSKLVTKEDILLTENSNNDLLLVNDPTKPISNTV